MRNRPLFLMIALVAVVAVSACLLTGCGSIVLSGGLSAYEIAVQNGFVGTEAEWLVKADTSSSTKGSPEIFLTKV